MTDAAINAWVNSHQVIRAVVFVLAGSLLTASFMKPPRK